MLLSAFRRWILLSLIPVAIVIYSSRVLLVDDTDIDFLYEPEKARRIAKKWDESNKTFVAGGAWHQHALVVKTYKQRLAAGSENFVSHILNRYGKKTKCLSIGCGDGGIETEMVEEGLCETMKGIDLSPIRIEGANSNVPLHLKEKLVFTVENAETGLSGEHYDLVLFTHALHHIFNLEAMIDAINEKILATSGILVLEEYIGPVRWQFSKNRLNYMATFLKDVERKFPQRVESLRNNPLWDGIKFRNSDPVAIRNDDPSETVRSNEIFTVLSRRMKLLENVDLGGNFFQWIFHNIYNSLKDEEGNQIVQSMLEAEMKFIGNGTMSSDYVFQVWGRQE